MDTMEKIKILAAAAKYDVSCSSSGSKRANSGGIGNAESCGICHSWGRKTAIYRNIKELELEYKMGRLAESDFQRLEAEHKNEAIEILQKLDALNVNLITPKTDTETNTCPSCGAKTISGKKFCADCGAKLRP